MMFASEEKILLSRIEAAGLLSISVRTLDYLVERGELPSRRLGTRILIERRAVEKFAQRDHPAPIRSAKRNTKR